MSRRSRARRAGRDGGERSSRPAARAVPVELPEYWSTTEGVNIVPDYQKASQMQAILDATWRVKWTRDRKRDKTGKVPTRATVLNVLRVENHEAFARYWNFLSSARSKATQTPIEPFRVETDRIDIVDGSKNLDPSVNEKYLFHGTNPTSADSIARTDFDMELVGSAVGTMFGPGHYLAENASKADEYAREGDGIFVGQYALLLCRAVAGRVFNVEDKGDQSEAVLSGRYDCVCGDRLAAVGTFREMIFFNSDQIYAEYIVLYRREYGDDEEVAKRKAEAEAEAAAKRAAEEKARAEEEARRRAEEESRRRVAEEKARAEEEARRRAEEESRRRVAEEKARAEEEARRRAEEESRRRVAEEKARAEEEVRRRAEEESRRRVAEEKARAEEEERAARSDPALNQRLNDAARNTNDTALIRHLVDQGADLKSTNGPHWRHTPLHQACFHGRTEVVRCLLELGAYEQCAHLDSNPCGRRGTGLPIELARGGGHHEIAKLMEDHARRLPAAVSERAARSDPALNQRLNDAARNTNDTALIRHLVDQGADLKSTNGPEWRHTPLHQACFHGRTEVVRCLLELGAYEQCAHLDSNPCGRRGTGLPIELARGGGHHEIAKLMEDHARGLPAELPRAPAAHASPGGSTSKFRSMRSF
eukprot:TRINITY_DN12900_c0_g1_i7.p1 TRINITY_DN12900_c0_g1~~TRINITY_DN12900_c0_g1_i7.p1  ORF type:complete len:649 (+),score=130.91 TRINITY_DN12900_c0_g1_i7:49-1995(+)